MDAFVGEVRAFAFGLVPKGWIPCQGQTLPINQYQVLFALLGNRYGGDGRTTFGLPDLRGRVVVSAGQKDTFQYLAGQIGGIENVPLTGAQMPLHTHPVKATTETGTVAQPSVGGTDNVIAVAATRPTGGTPVPLYAPGTSGGVPLAAGSVSATGAGAPHSNVQPTTTTNYCIASTGYFPSRQ